MGERPERRLDRVGKQAKSGDPKLKQEAAGLERILAHIDAGATLADPPGALPAALEPLTTKPLIAVENGPAGIDLKLSPDGRVVCFEVNPMPAYSYFQREAGQPIARALIDLLAAPASVASRAR